MYVFISDTFTPITTGEFTRRARDISVFETKLDLYYETAQKHENEMKTLFERLNTDTNDVIKDFEVFRLKICLLPYFNLIKTESSKNCLKGLLLTQSFPGGPRQGE